MLRFALIAAGLVALPALARAEGTPELEALTSAVGDAQKDAAALVERSTMAPAADLRAPSGAEADTLAAVVAANNAFVALTRRAPALLQRNTTVALVGTLDAAQSDLLAYDAARRRGDRQEMARAATQALLRLDDAAALLDADARFRMDNRLPVANPAP